MPRETESRLARRIVSLARRNIRRTGTSDINRIHDALAEEGYTAPEYSVMKNILVKNNAYIPSPRGGAREHHGRRIQHGMERKSGHRAVYLDNPYAFEPWPEMIDLNVYTF